MCLETEQQLISYCLNLSAPAYSQLAAVLASFVFAAIVLALGTPPKNKSVKDISLPLASSFSAFLSLLVSCYLFATLSGEQTLLRAHVFGYAASFIFSLAALQLILSLAWYFSDYETVRAVHRVVYWFVQGIIAVISLHAVDTSVDLRAIATNQAPGSTNFELIAGICGVGLIFLPWGVALYIRHHLSDHSGSYRKACWGTLIFSVILMVVGTLGAGSYIEFSDQPTGSDNVTPIQLLLLGTFLMLLLYLWLYQLALPNIPEDPPRQDESSKEAKLLGKEQEETFELITSQALTPSSETELVLLQKIYMLLEHTLSGAHQTQIESEFAERLEEIGWDVVQLQEEANLPLEVVQRALKGGQISPDARKKLMHAINKRRREKNLSPLTEAKLFLRQR